MTVNYTSLLSLALPVTGTESGTWGDDVSNGITSYVDVAIAGTLSFSGDGAITLANTQGTSSATNLGSTSAQYMALRFTGSLTTTKVVTAPSTSKLYLVDNATSGGFGVTVKASGQTGYTVSAGTKAWVYYNGTDYVLASTNDITKLTGTLAVSNGGTGASSASITAFNNITGYSASGATGTTSTNLVFSTSPTLTTPNLGTPSAATLTNATGLPLTTGVTGTLATTNGGTGQTSFTSGGVVYASSSSALATGSALTFDGFNLATNLGGTISTIGINSTSSSIYMQSRPDISYSQLISSAYLLDLVTFANQPILFRVNGSEQMRLTSTGLGIGTSSPAGSLEILRTSTTVPAIRLRYNSTTYYADFLMAPSGNALLNIPALNGVASGNFSINLNGTSITNRAYTVYGNGSHEWCNGTGTTFMTLDTSGNLGLGVTPSAWVAGYKALQVGNASWYTDTNGQIQIASNTYQSSGFVDRYIVSNYAAKYEQLQSAHKWYTAPSGTAGNAISFTQAMTLDASGNLVVGDTSTNARIRALSTGSNSQCVYFTHPTSAQDVISCENSATSGNNVFIQFYSDAAVSRGTISYNRTAGLVSYGTTSDYRAKDIIGPVTDAGATIDALKVYMGKMKGATLERPMLIAHEAQAVTPYAVTGEKDAVNEDGTPKYQQMDHQMLVPLLIAEIKSLRSRLAAAGI